MYTNVFRCKGYYVCKLFSNILEKRIYKYIYIYIHSHTHGERGGKKERETEWLNKDVLKIGEAGLRSIRILWTNFANFRRLKLFQN